jgi:hypothetical protein
MTRRFTEEEITARAWQFADDQVGEDTGELRYRWELALKELEAKEPRLWRSRPARPGRSGSSSLIDLAQPMERHPRGNAPTMFTHRRPQDIHFDQGGTSWKCDRSLFLKPWK